MRWFGGGGAEERKRTALAQLFGALGEGAFGSALALKELAKEIGVDQARFSGEVFFRVTLEFLYFYLHLTDRAAFSNLGMAKRDTLIDLARDWCISHLVSSSIKAVTKEQLEGIQNSALAEFNDRQQEYGSCREISVTSYEMSMITLGSIGFGGGNPYPDPKTDPVGAALVNPARDYSVVGRFGANVARTLDAQLSEPLVMAIVAITGEVTNRDLRKKIVNAGRDLP